MSGFKNQILNEIAKKNIFEDMIDFIFVSLKNMKNDLICENKKLKNDEEKIRTHLLENYLNNTDFKQNVNFSNLYLLFEKEVPEGYEKEEEKYIGRVDIKVFSINTLINNPKDYYIIECKRIDGTNKLNEKYVTEGICRFVLENPKYTSFNEKNIMLGFVVEDINIDSNIKKINDIQDEMDNIHIVEKLSKVREDNEEFYLYKNKYQVINQQIGLYHMFYKLNEVI